MQPGLKRGLQLDQFQQPLTTLGILHFLDAHKCHVRHSAISEGIRMHTHEFETEAVRHQVSHARLLLEGLLGCSKLLKASTLPNQVSAWIHALTSTLDPIQSRRGTEGQTRRPLLEDTWQRSTGNKFITKYTRFLFNNQRLVSRSKKYPGDCF